MMTTTPYYIHLFFAFAFFSFPPSSSPVWDISLVSALSFLAIVPFLSFSLAVCSFAIYANHSRFITHTGYHANDDMVMLLPNLYHIHVSPYLYNPSLLKV